MQWEHFVKGRSAKHHLVHVLLQDSLTPLPLAKGIFGRMDLCRGLIQLQLEIPLLLSHICLKINLDGGR